VKNMSKLFVLCLALGMALPAYADRRGGGHRGGFGGHRGGHHGGHHGGHRGGHHGGRGDSTGAAIAAGAIIGGLIIGAIASSQANQHPAPAPQEPDMPSAGSFEGALQIAFANPLGETVAFPDGYVQMVKQGYVGKQYCRKYSVLNSAGQAVDRGGMCMPSSGGTPYQVDSSLLKF
jgi:hypothetical protein